MSDLRRDERVDLEAPAGIVHGTQRHWAMMRNISLGGMFLVTEARIPCRAPLVVRIAIPEEAEPYCLPAVVRWSHPAGLGVQFGRLGSRETFFVKQVGRCSGGAVPMPNRTSRSLGVCTNGAP